LQTSFNGLDLIFGQNKFLTSITFKFVLLKLKKMWHWRNIILDKLYHGTLETKFTFKNNELREYYKISDYIQATFGCGFDQPTSDNISFLSIG